jgi:hypothetical protein
MDSIFLSKAEVVNRHTGFAHMAINIIKEIATQKAGLR